MVSPMRLCVILLLICCSLVAMPSHATTPNAEEDAAQKMGASGLPLPRFASLRSDEVNMRTGPGTRYPIEWVYREEGLPVEIIAEYEFWRRVKDWEGTEGWVQKATLSGKRGAIIHGKPRELRAKDKLDATIVAHLEVGAVGQIQECHNEWCEIAFGKTKGYLRKDEFWGAYPDEDFE